MKGKPLKVKKHAEGGPIKIRPEHLKKFFKTLEDLNLTEYPPGPWDYARSARILNEELNKPTPKKWWGGPLAGFAPWQNQGTSAFSGLGQNFPPKPTVAPMLPSLSGLMAKPANGWQGPMGSYQTGGRSTLGAGKTRVPGGGRDMLLRSDIEMSLLPDDFYWIEGLEGDPIDYLTPSPREERMQKDNPELHGRPVASLKTGKFPQPSMVEDRGLFHRQSSRRGKAASGCKGLPTKIRS